MTSAIATLRASFSPFRFPNFRLYMGGQTLSLIGTWLQITAQSWVIWQLTGSEASLGIVQMFSSLPLLFLSPWAGVWADRVDRRKLLIGLQFFAMLFAFILASLTWTSLIQPWHIYVLAFLLGIVSALEFPAQQAFLGDLAGMGEVRKAINLNIMILQMSRVLGPALAGILLSRIGAASAFLLNGLSFLAVIVSLFYVRSNQQRIASSDNNPLHQIVDALRFVGMQPRVQDLMIFTALATFCVFSIILTQLPAVADQRLGGNEETFGLLTAASGAGALISVLLVVPLAQSLPRSGLVVAGAAVWSGLWLLVFSQAQITWLAALSLFFVSTGGPVIVTTSMGLTQVMSPPEMRARVISLFTMVSFGLQPLAALFIGGFAERYGVENAILFNAVALLIGACLMLSLRGDLRRWVRVNAPTPQPVLEHVA
jgi:MFS family permease